MEYEIVIGLEVHVHLKTLTKAFCGCSAEFGNEPNSQVCPVCLGFPGTLPVLNKVAFEYAQRVGLALNCQIQEYTKFDRKNYFYPDLPKNYQISQYDLPLAKNGFLDIEVDGSNKHIRVLRVHLEEDAGKLIHKDEVSLVDYNRAGIALLEIVSEPDIRSPLEAHGYLTALKSILEYLGVSDCDMEKGSLRCDANISLREKGNEKLGTKAELKNLNSFKAVKDALAYEAERQAELLDQGQAIIQETRLWDVKTSNTVAMRSKEEAQDYRYFPEPDLPPYFIAKEDIENIKSRLPELPQEKKSRFMKEYSLSAYDSEILVSSKKDAEYAETCLRMFTDKNKKPVVNWLIGPVLSEAKLKNCGISDLGIVSDDLIRLIGFVERDEISNLSAKTVLSEVISTGKAPEEIIKDKNLIQISDSGSLEKVIAEVISENAASVTDYKQGKVNALMFLVGQVMRKTKGKANPKILQDLIKRRLDNA